MGPRRVGKTVMVHQAIAELIRKKVEPRRILYVPLDNPLYSGLSLEKILLMFVELNSIAQDEETKRLYSVLDERLSEVEYLAGEYSIADIATWPWINAYDWAELDLGAFPNLTRWHAEVGERPAVIKGNEIPPSSKKEETEEERIKRIQKLLS